MFRIPQGAEVLKLVTNSMVVRQVAVTCKRDVLFAKEDVVIDPVGTLGHTNRANIDDIPVHTLGKRFCRAGYYGFKHKGRTILIRANAVEYLD